jgi:hypothetical protein
MTAASVLHAACMVRRKAWTWAVCAAMVASDQPSSLPMIRTTVGSAASDAAVSRKARRNRRASMSWPVYGRCEERHQKPWMDACMDGTGRGTQTDLGGPGPLVADGVGNFALKVRKLWVDTLALPCMRWGQGKHVGDAVAVRVDQVLRNLCPCARASVWSLM